MAEPSSSKGVSVRKLLVIADETPECRLALHYAARQAQLTHGHVSLLYIIEPLSPQQWMAVETRMREEAREEAEKLLFALASDVNKSTGLRPELVIREGETRESLLGLLGEDSDIRLIVLAVGIAREGPGPPVSAFAAELAAFSTVPVTIVPGGMSIAAIDALG